MTRRQDMTKTTKTVTSADAFQKFAVAMESVKARETLTGFPIRDKISNQLTTTNRIKQMEARK